MGCVLWLLGGLVVLSVAGSMIESAFDDDGCGLVVGLVLALGVIGALVEGLDTLTGDRSLSITIVLILVALAISALGISYLRERHAKKRQALLDAEAQAAAKHHEQEEIEKQKLAEIRRSADRIRQSLIWDPAFRRKHSEFPWPEFAQLAYTVFGLKTTTGPQDLTDEEVLTRANDVLQGSDFERVVVAEIRDRHAFRDWMERAIHLRAGKRVYLHSIHARDLKFFFDLPNDQVVLCLLEEHIALPDNATIDEIIFATQEFVTTLSTHLNLVRESRLERIARERLSDEESLLHCLKVQIPKVIQLFEAGVNEEAEAHYSAFVARFRNLFPKRVPALGDLAAGHYR